MAQTATLPAIDTLTNTDTARMVAKINGSNTVVSIQATYTKISGTSATNVFVQGSLDGVNYVPISDTLTITNVAGPQTKVFTLGLSEYLWYRVFAITAGTQSGQLKAVWIARP